MSYQDVKDRLYRGHRRIANNTYLMLDGNSNISVDIREPSDIRKLSEHIDMELHGNLVARFYHNHLELYSAGWHTTTTKNRLNLALELAQVNRLADDSYRVWNKKIYQVDYQWYYGNYHKGDTRFTEGMCINYNGKVIGGR